MFFRVLEWRESWCCHDNRVELAKYHSEERRQFSNGALLFRCRKFLSMVKGEYLGLWISYSLWCLSNYTEITVRFKLCWRNLVRCIIVFSKCRNIAEILALSTGNQSGWIGLIDSKPRTALEGRLFSHRRLWHIGQAIRHRLPVSHEISYSPYCLVRRVVWSEAYVGSPKLIPYFDLGSRAVSIPQGIHGSPWIGGDT